jgi:hypothetical protein
VHDIIIATVTAAAAAAAAAGTACRAQNMQKKFKFF